MTVCNQLSQISHSVIPARLSDHVARQLTEM